MKKFSTLIISLAIGCAHVLAQNAIEKPNILFIAVDDLKPLLGCYGDTLAVTPHLDALAEKGTTFTASYCQQAVCAPSRVSLMTSRYPDQTRVWDLHTQMRDMNPHIVTLPQYLISRGYRTSGTGKILDFRSVDGGQDTPSWSVAFRNAWDPKYYNATTGKPMYYFYASEHARDTFNILEAEADALGVDKTTYVKTRYFPAFENAAVPIDAYTDGAIANVGIELMEESASSAKPFFLAVGFNRPHLPFNAPKQFWDLYKRDDFTLSPFRSKATASPSLAYHNSGELRNGYTGIPENGELPEALQLELIHGYYAATSYIDHLVGLLMDKLNELGLADNTIVVLWGDHGWHLGDHQLWCKHSNFEQATRAPLIIHCPGQSRQGEICPAPVEFTDIAPTLCDLAGLDIPGYFEGKSLVGLMQDPEARVREASLSQYPRNDQMGYSIRTERFRYTKWMSSDGSAYARELYDYQEDPLETINVVTHPVHADIVQRLDSLVTERIAIPSTQTRISFLVEGPDLNGGYGPVPNLRIKLAGESKLSQVSGALMFTHHRGMLTYQVEASGYVPRKDTVQIVGDTLIVLSMQLEKPVYHVSVSVSDFYTKKKLASALVSMDDEEKRTDSEGSTSFYVKKGVHILNLERLNYPRVTDTLDIANDTSIQYALKATHSTIKIWLSEGSTPVNNARVTLHGEEQNSNAMGVTTFESLPTALTYTYDVEKQGYKSLSGSLFLQADTALTLQMEALTASGNSDSPDDFRVWPNPAGEFVIFKLAEISGRKRIKLVNASGLVVLDRSLKEEQETLHISHLSPGIYLVQHISEHQIQHVKLLIQ